VGARGGRRRRRRRPRWPPWPAAAGRGDREGGVEAGSLGRACASTAPRACACPLLHFGGWLAVFFSGRFDVRHRESARRRRRPRPRHRQAVV
jgi:hypothetical protein